MLVSNPSIRSTHYITCKLRRRGGLPAGKVPAHKKTIADYSFVEELPNQIILGRVPQAMENAIAVVLRMRGHYGY